MRYKWMQTGGLGAFTGVLRNLLEVMCNWRIHEVGASRAKPSGLAILKNNVYWTDELHARMGVQFPLKEGTS